MNIERRLLLAALAAAPLAAYAQSPDRRDVQWAGLSYLGSLDEAKSLMPVVMSLVGDPTFSQALQTRLNQAVAGTAHPELHFVHDRLAALGDDSYALAFALAGESVTHLKVEEVTEASFELQALVLIGNVSKDPQRQRLVGYYPLRVRHRTVYPDGRLPTAEDARRAFTSMLMGDRRDGVADLLAEWQSRLARVRINERDKWVALSPVKFSPDAQAEAKISAADAQAMSVRATSLIEANISRVAEIPLVPFPRTGSGDAPAGAIGHLTLSFGDRGDLAFRNPDPSDVLDFTVTALKTAVIEQALSREKRIALVFGAGVQVDYARVAPDRSKVPELSVRLKHVQSRSFIGASSASRQIDNRAAFGALLMNFADQMSTNLVKADRRWLETAKADSETRSVDDLARLLRERLPFRTA